MSNDHVSAYLDQYLSKPPSGGVLIVGSWGSGKTFVVKRYFRQNPQDHIYVSANGARDTEELRRRFVYTAYPVLGNKTMRTLGSLAKSALGVVGFEPQLEVDTLVDFNGISRFVVDDLERSIMPIDELLGFINAFVEEDGKHVVLIGNEKELEKREGYSRIKEKTIEFTLSVRPETDNALSALRDQLPSNFWSFVQSRRSTILSVFHATSSDNLRILKQSVVEFWGDLHLSYLRNGCRRR